MAMIPVADALSKLLTAASRLDAEIVPIADAGYRVLAEPLAALRTQPPFNASAMDGYAVRAADLGPGAVLRVIGEAPAGRAFAGTVGEGEAVRIFTGAPVPPGADTILIQENAKIAGDKRIIASQSEPLGRFVRPAGLDFSEGDQLLEAGRVLDPAALSLAAAANHADIPVVRRVRVAILATGDELLPPGSSPGPDQIIASNSYGVAALARQLGADVRDLGIAPDSEQAIRKAIDKAKTWDADIIVTLGGASVGDHDLARRALEASGMVLDFWRIAMRPGKPLMVGRLDSATVLGLPGNPVSSLVCAHLFIKPLLARLGGKPITDDRLEAELQEPLSANDEREDYVRAVCRRVDGDLRVTAFGKQDSSMLKTLAAANALIVRPPHAEAAEAGSRVTVILLRPVE